ncbi:type VI secretion system Vgr family protein [Bordetella sp. H567]|uniref:type VI secretion system Vgr family protein n=1 Tax=Bordetella sp. H567 TaxID=1697043 RepID=UPI001F160E0D|nr:type VI secretion system tip protein TssI/VgrG [Bordetella sp. H567]
MLAADTLLLCGLRGEERLGKPFEFRLELLSADAGIDPAKLLGSEIRVRLDTSSGKREFNGIVSRFGIAGAALSQDRPDRLTRYRAIMRPRLWLLSRSSHCRFFFDMSVPDIVRQLLDDHQVVYRIACTASYPKLQHCAQYRETDLDFMSRLLEREGIYYYFEHANGTETVVLVDSPQAHEATPGYESILFSPLAIDDGAPQESIYRWALDAEIAPGTSEFNAFDFLNVKSSESQGLLARATAEADTGAGTLEEYALRYDDQADGRRHAQARLDAHRARSRRATGRATARGVKPGAWFRMTDHPRADQNDEYLVVSADYRLGGDDYTAAPRAAHERKPVFDCTFSAIPRQQPWRAACATPVPRPGLQTAMVVAPDGEPMATDAHGRVKVQFHWEQFNPPKASQRMQRCWVRVAQAWAGKGWGAVFVPRAGQEVVVDFLDGDPDHPMIVGSVYNSRNPPPYIGAGHAEIAAIRTDSLGDGEKDRNELRFNDKALQVLLYTGGRFDTYVKKSGFTWVGEDEHRTVKGRQLLHAGAQHISVSGSRKVKVDGSASLKAAVNVLHQAGMSYVVNGEMVHIKGGATVVIEAEAMVSLKVGNSFISVNAAGVQISGPIVALNSEGAAGSGPGGSPESPETPEKADDGSSVQVK